MNNKFAIRKKGTDQFLSTPTNGRRSWRSINNAQLWHKRHHAQLSVNYRYNRGDKDVEIMEFKVVLIDAKKGYIG